MRLKKYISEQTKSPFSVSDEIEEKAINLIKKDCKQYLKYFNPRKPLYRGTEISNVKWKTAGYHIGVKKVRKDRKSFWWGTTGYGPGIFSRRIFSRINDWLTLVSHVRRDRSVSATPDKRSAMTFGDAVYYFFPIGRFNYSFINRNDFHDIKDEAWEDIMDGKKKDPITTNQNMKTAIDKKYEIWFDCNSYYIVSPYLFDEIKYKLK